ncbi:WD40 repeat domain-containing protein [Desulfovibrio sp. UCD-KL4C]|uniref:WD40 repeat domain-containing protein n=1 Tax=Desulfovibrio sp. UCD-KL4C TaxID=2578120 RepID=UPI0025C560C1|nr:WD40 repeat domain-containing protein [Desulfovibrio sp. UCD-KL4C]
MILRFSQVKPLILFFALILVSIPVSSRAQSGDSKAERVGQKYIDIPTELNKGTAGSLKKYVSKLLGEKYVSAGKLYAAPFEGLEDKFYISVTREKAIPIIAGGVSSYAGNEEGLAAALYDGSIRLWSNYLCKEVKLPSGKGAKLVAYAPESPVLAATDSDGDNLFIYDLKTCTRIPGDIPIEHGPVKMMAISRTGDWLGLIDSFNTLLCGPSSGPLKEVSMLEGTPLFIGYTPGQGILVVVEASGKIVLWGMKNLSSINSDEAPGGPFTSVRMSGYVVCLRRDDGKEIYWDLRKRSLVKKSDAIKESPAWVYEKDGALVYSTGVDRWKVAEHFGMPMFIVSYSAKEKLIRVRDLDSKTRYYSTLDGKEFSEIKTSDWKLVSPKNGIYKASKKSFRFFDSVCQKGIQRLYCRYIDGKGFYLWWRQAVDVADLNPHPMELPIRECILADQPAVWTPLIQGEIW